MEASTCPAFTWSLRPLPPGRLPFRRWRYELWQGAALVAAGWRTAPAAAALAVRTAAVRRAHDLLGVCVLRPERHAFRGALRPGAEAEVSCGPVRAVLRARDDPERARGAGAAAA